MVCLLNDVQVQLKVRRTLSSVGTSSSNNSSSNKDYNATAAVTTNNNDKGKNDINEDKDGAAAAVAAAAASGLVSSSSISGSNCRGVGGGGLGRWQVVVVVGIIVCRTTTALCGLHNNQPEEGHAAKIPVTEAKLQATTSPCDKRMRGRHYTNTSPMTARRQWRQW